MTTELLMVGALSRGLTLRDFDTLTVGQVVDFCAEYNARMSDDGEKPKERKATQADFDAF